jgi:hypothetical protein
MRWMSAGFLGVWIFGLAPVLLADAWNKKTILTVNEEILVPGAVLQPGKYVMKLVDSLGNRHIVQITNERENEVLTTILAIPNYRLKVTGNTQFEFWETPAGNPRALRAWFYPGDNFGQEFAYPKGLSAKIAKAAEEPVPTVAAETPAELKTAPVTAVEETGEEKPLVAEAYTPPAPEPEPVAEPEPLVAERAEPELPATATPFPMIGLAGALALFSGLALRKFAARR